MYRNWGNVHSSLEDIRKAIDYHKRHLKIAKESGDRSDEGKVCGDLGNTYHLLGDFKTAKTYHEIHLKIAKESGDRSEEGTACCHLGNAFRRLGDIKTAKVYHESHLEIAKELGDRLGEGAAYNSLGNAHFSLGNFKTAIDYYERFLEISRELGDRYGEGAAYGNLGTAHQDLGNFKTAINFHKRSLKIANELGDRSSEGKAYGSLGNVHQNLGDFKTAIDYHERGLKIWKEFGDISGEGKSYGNLGNAHHKMGNFKTAIDYHKRHLKIAKELNERSDEGKACGNLGNCYYNLGDIKTAIDYIDRYLKIAKELGDRLQEGAAYRGLGQVHQRLGDIKTAIDFHEHSLNIAKELGDRPGEGSAYGSLGNAHQDLGNIKTAIHFHECHLKIMREIGDRSGKGDAYINLGKAYQSLGDSTTAIEYYECALKIARELGDMLQEAIACSNLGARFVHRGQIERAIEYYQLGISLLNNIRDRLQLNDELKISLRDHYQRIYTALWRLMLTEGNYTEALFSAEKGRAQGLKDLMALNYIVEENDTELKKENRTFHELSCRLPSNTIFMAIGCEGLILWVCQPGREVELRGKLINSERDINNFFQSLVKKIGGIGCVDCEDRTLALMKGKRLEVERSPQSDKQTEHIHLQERTLSTLYDIIIDPIQDLFSGSELVFVPEGPLCLAPFAAFMGPDSKYLCESFRIRVAPSLTSLKMIADCPLDYHLTSGVLLVGDPWVQDVTTLKPLPYAREEVEMIGRVLGGCTPLTGRQATKDEVLKRLGSVALVHFAAHGSMEAGEIALAPKNGEMDFILTMKDVKRVQIRARLVVLSCCHSAHGEIKAEGVVGIARAFLGAGARSVLVSLWAIDDKATLEFMKHFYQHLVEGESASKALNQAMNCMRESREFSAVNHWAPFLLIGDDVTLEFGGSK